MTPEPMGRNDGQRNFNPGRREFARLALAGTLGGAVLAARSSPGSSAPGAPTLHDLSLGIKIAAQFMNDVSEEDLQFVNEVGAEYVSIWLHAVLATYENFVRLWRKVEAAGLKLWNIGNYNVHNMEEVTLNLPGREEKIEAYKSYLRTLGKAGIYSSTLAFMGNGI
jgi:mannonate dehydratase